MQVRTTQKHWKYHSEQPKGESKFDRRGSLEAIRQEKNAATPPEARTRRILLTGSPIKVAKGPPKGLRKALQRQLQPLQNVAKVLPRGVLEENTLKAWFLTDVLNGIHVFGCPKEAFRHPRTNKNCLWTPSGESSGRWAETSETGTPKKSFFAPEALRGEPAFEAWTRERGPQLYIDIKTSKN